MMSTFNRQAGFAVLMGAGTGRQILNGLTAGVNLRPALDNVFEVLRGGQFVGQGIGIIAEDKGFGGGTISRVQVDDDIGGGDMIDQFVGQLLFVGCRMFVFADNAV